VDLTITLLLYCIHVFFYKKSKFRKQAGVCLWIDLVQVQNMLALCLLIKTFYASNTLINEMCCWYDTEYYNRLPGHRWPPFVLSFLTYSILQGSAKCLPYA